MIDDLENSLELLFKRGWRDKDKLFKKIVEEIGEYSEALTFEAGATRKVAKYKGIFPKDKCREEICDVLMMALALAKMEDFTVLEALEAVNDKLKEREKEKIRGCLKY